MSWNDKRNVVSLPARETASGGGDADAETSDDARFIAELISLRTCLRLRALSWVQDGAAADDLVQEGLEKALVHRCSFHRGSNMKAWITSIMRNVFIDGWRRSAFYADIGDQEPPAPPQCPLPPDPTDLLSMSDVRTALTALTAPDRAIFERAYFDNAPRREIASDFQVPLNTIGTRLFRAKRKLRRVLVEIYQKRLTESGTRPR
jgi:RNA polymerase sigma-70 factor (ECF subfamily)